MAKSKESSKELVNFLSDYFLSTCFTVFQILFCFLSLSLFIQIWSIRENSPSKIHQIPVWAEILMEMMILFGVTQWIHQILMRYVNIPLPCYVARTLLSWSCVVSETCKFPTRVSCVLFRICHVSICRVHFNISVSVQHSCHVHYYFWFWVLVVYQYICYQLGFLGR